MVLMITVLLVNLSTGFITNYIIHYPTNINPLKYTAIAMIALSFILVPSYRYMSGRIEILVARILVSGSNSFGKTIGLLISFTFIFSILFAIYLHLWFHINLLEAVKNQSVFNYFSLK